MNAAARLATSIPSARSSTPFLEQEEVEELAGSVSVACSNLAQKSELSLDSESEAHNFITALNRHLSEISIIRTKMLNILHPHVIAA